MTFTALLFLAYVALLPTQLAYFWWPDWAMVHGIRVDYLAPSIYSTDIILVLLIALWLARTKPRIKINKCIALFLFANILFNPPQSVTLIRYISLLKFYLLFLFVTKNRGLVKKYLPLGLTLSLIYIFPIAIYQLLYQKSLGGIAYYLGERSFNIATPGIAKELIFAREYLRPYATFPHPNALAGYSLVALLLLRKFNIFFIILILISFSQGAWLAAVLALVFVAFNKYLKFWHLKTTLNYFIIGSLLSIILYPLWGGSYRAELLFFAGKMLSESPFLGVGLGNFIVSLSNYNYFWLQPVHNIFVLLLVELGIVGFVLVYVFLVRLIDKNKRRVGYLVPMVAILATGFVDHYWLTLNQTQALLTIYLGLLWWGGGKVNN